MLKVLYNLLLHDNHVHVFVHENNDYAAGTISSPFQIHQFIITWKTDMALIQSLLLLLILSFFTCFSVYFSNYFVTIKMHFYQETNPFL